MFFGMRCVLVGALITACSDEPGLRPQPQPPSQACRADQPCTAGHCPGARKITVGVQRCALLCDDTVRCSESGDSFTATADTAPLDVVVDGATDLVSGALHSCALLRDGAVTCWGNNRWGALGLEADRTDRWYAPAAMPGLSHVVALSARDAFYQFDWTCALEEDGEVACWGYDLVGVTRVPELKGARAIRVGDGEVYGLMSDRRVLMYSFNTGVKEFELARPVRDLEAGWHAFCAGDGASLQCIDMIYQDELVAMPLPGQYRKLAHGWSKPLIIDDQSRVHVGDAQTPDTWTPMPELDRALGLATGVTVAGGACGLFVDGRITCVEAL